MRLQGAAQMGPLRVGQMPNIFDTAKAAGRQIVAQSTTADFALDVLRAVVRGEVTAEDAERLYLAFYDSTIKRSTGQSYASRKVQVSKLRKIMQLGEEWPDTAETLLLEVIAAHRKKLIRGEDVLSLYPAMVEAARIQLQATKPIGKAGIDKAIATKRKRRG